MGAIVVEVSVTLDNMKPHPPVSVNFADAILVCALREPSSDEPHTDRGPEDKTRRSNLKLPEVTLSQPHEHATFLPLHPELIVLLQLLSLALAVECRGQGIMIIWSA